MMPLCRPLADLLKRRGIEDPDDFARPSTWNDLPHPGSITGMDDAVSRILLAARQRERVFVFGDYDCDGVLSTAILDAVLRKIGIASTLYLPHRDEGYGFTEHAVHRFSRAGTDLVITIDNGINAAGPIRLAQRLGMDVVVVDHHHIETRANAAGLVGRLLRRGSWSHGRLGCARTRRTG